MRSERYALGPSLARKLPDVVRRVDELTVGGPGRIPTAIQSLATPGGSGSGSSISIGAYNTNGEQWEKGTTQPVHIYEIGESSVLTAKYDGSGSPITATVLNLFVTIPPNYDRVRYCAYASVGSVNLLIAAEC